MMNKQFPGRGKGKNYQYNNDADDDAELLSDTHTLVHSGKTEMGMESDLNRKNDIFRRRRTMPSLDVSMNPSLRYKYSGLSIPSMTLKLATDARQALYDLRNGKGGESWDKALASYGQTIEHMRFSGRDFDETLMPLMGELPGMDPATLRDSAIQALHNANQQIFYTGIKHRHLKRQKDILDEDRSDRRKFRSAIVHVPLEYNYERGSRRRKKRQQGSWDHHKHDIYLQNKLS